MHRLSFFIQILSPLLQIGPKGLEFARYSLDYHTIRNYLYVHRKWGKNRYGVINLFLNIKNKEFSVNYNLIVIMTELMNTCRCMHRKLLQCTTKMVKLIRCLRLNDLSCRRRWIFITFLFMKTANMYSLSISSRAATMGSCSDDTVPYNTFSRLVFWFLRVYFSFPVHCSSLYRSTLQV